MSRQIQINRLHISNFKGVRDFTLQLDGAQGAAIKGDNGVGKTTLVDAWCWLLFGKDSGGRATFEVKTLDENGEPAHGLEHEVEADLRDGKTVRNFRKVYKEVWTKRRGAASKEFTGHTTNHFVDGVPVAQREYQEAVASLCPEEPFRILTEPGYFAEQVTWQDRREVVLEVCGDISSDDVIKSNADLADLPELLGSHTADQRRKIVEARRREINRELDDIPVRISEANLAMPDTPEDEDEVKQRLVGFRSARRQAQEDHARVSSGGQAGELTNELRTLEADIQKMQTSARIALEETVGPKRRAVTDAEGEVRDAGRDARLARAAVEDTNKGCDIADGLVADSQKRWADIDLLEFDGGDVEDKCPTCNRKLAASKVQAARDEALANFNDDKGTRLASVEGEEKMQQAKLDELRLALQGTLVPAVDAADQVAIDADAKLAAAQEELAAVEGGELDFSTVDGWTEAAVRRDQLKTRLEELKTGHIDTLDEVQERIDALDKTIARDETIAGRFDQRRRGEKRIKELETTHRQLAGEFEDLERELFLLDEYVRTKVKFIERSINDKFKLASFKMFKVLVNGGLEECCEVTYKGVPYSSNLNHGAQVQVGMDIIGTLQGHFGFAPPVWVDQSESITSLPGMDCQVLRLCVSPEHDILTVEID